MKRSKIFAHIFVFALKVYQNTLRFALPQSCRFHPSCSDYSMQALRKYGFLRGGWLGLKRILRCNPLHPGGYDPVE